MVAHRRPAAAQRGASMIEVLVTLVVIAFGLLGMAGLQVRLQMSEMESYQRSQALLLLNDMANRMATNRTNVAAYVTASAVGAGMTCPSSVSTTIQRDLTEWCNALQGAGETITGGGITSQLGAMVGGRGCVESIGSDYMITVSWQGLTPLEAPPASVTCGANSYDGGSSCTGDRCRRSVTTIVRVAAL